MTFGRAGLVLVDACVPARVYLTPATPLRPPLPRRRATPAALKLVSLWQAHLKTRGHEGWRTKDDQLPANLVFKNLSAYCPMFDGARGSGHYHASQEKYRSVCGEDSMLNIVADGSGCVGILNVVQFANGFVFSTQRSHEQHFVRPYTFHATYSNDKLMSLRQEGIFFDNPDYYWIPNGVLVYDPVLRMDMFHPTLGAPRRAGVPWSTFLVAICPRWSDVLASDHLSPLRLQGRRMPWRASTPRRRTWCLSSTSCSSCESRLQSQRRSGARWCSRAWRASASASSSRGRTATSTGTACGCRTSARPTTGCARAASRCRTASLDSW